MTRPSSLLRNLSWLALGNGIAKPFWFLFVTYGCIRVLALEEYGHMAAALATMGLLTGLAAVGLSQHIALEVARDRRTAPSLLQVGLRVRLVLVSLAVLAGIGLGAGRAPGGALIGVYALAGLYWSGLAVVELLRAFLRGTERFDIDARLSIVEKALTVILGYAGLMRTRSAEGALGGMAVGMLLAMGITYVVVRRVARADGAQEAVEGVSPAQLLRAAFPLGLASIFVLVYTRMDLLLLDALRGAEAAGLYGFSHRFLEALLLLPEIALAALLPRLSGFYHTRVLGAFRQHTGWLLAGLAGAGSLAALTMSLGAPLLLRAGGLAATPEAVATLSLLGWTVPVAFLNFALSSTLVIVDGRRANALLLGMGAVLNVALNLLLIPVWGTVGACAATLATEVLLAGLLARMLYRRLGVAGRHAVPLPL